MRKLNRAALALKTISKPMASRLNVKFQPSNARMANVGKGGPLGEKEKHADLPGAGFLATVGGLILLNEFKEISDHNKKLLAIDREMKELVDG